MGNQVVNQNFQPQRYILPTMQGQPVQMFPQGTPMVRATPRWAPPNQVSYILYNSPFNKF